jgi:hypothetical protein
MVVKLKRIFSNNFQTLGHLTLPSGKIYQTLELPDRGNQKKISCIPKGSYDVVKRKSAKYGDHFHVLNVPNRDFILIHHGNYYTDILGCILVGKGLADINGDGNLDVTSSKQAMKELNAALPSAFKLEIT